MIFSTFEIKVYVYLHSDIIEKILQNCFICYKKKKHATISYQNLSQVDLDSFDFKQKQIFNLKQNLT